MESKGEFFKDYQAMLLAVDRLKKDETNPFFKAKYVQLKDVLAEVKKVCKDHNFIFYQKPSVRYKENNHVNVLETIIQHKDGEKIEGLIEIISKDNNDPQKVGAGLTYMRRYSLTTMFGIEEEDDDGDSNRKTTTTGSKTCPDCNKKHNGQYPICLACYNQSK